MCERFKHFGEKDWKSATMLIHNTAFWKAGKKGKNTNCVK